MAVGEEGNIYIIWQETEGSQDILFSASIDPSIGFGEPVNISNDPGPESVARIATSTDKVFVVWFENDGEIYFANSTVAEDGNVGFSEPFNLSNNDGQSRNPVIAASGDNVYIAWEDDIDGSSIPDIFYTNSTDGGATFSGPVNLSDNVGSSRNPGLAISDANNVYVSWQDDSPNPENEQAIFVRASVDGGLSFGDAKVLSSNPEAFLGSPSIVSHESDIYMVWENATQDVEIFFTSGSVGGGGAISFGNVVNVSNNTGFSTSARLAVSASGVIYVAWIDDITGSNDVLMANSTDGGATFSVPIAISSLASVSSGAFHLVLLPTHPENVYAVWSDSNRGNGDIFVLEISSNGQTIGIPISVSDNDGASQKPVLNAFDQNLYIAWFDDSFDSSNEILFSTISAAEDEPSSIAIQSPNNTSPKWGQFVQISGTTNGANTDSVTVDWGDGSSNTDVPVNGSTWGPVSHAYDAFSVGDNQIVATLLDSGGAEKAMSNPSNVTVLKHVTSLTIDEGSNVVFAGDNITLSGTLTDADDSVGISSVSISFNGTGSGDLDATVTVGEGSYSIEGASPNSSGTLWNVQAIFLGDSAYEASSSSIATFDTASFTASVFSVPIGSPSVVELVGFNGTVTFDSTETEGTLFVSSCDVEDNPRYLSLNLCMVISYSEDLASGSYAHLTLSYAGRAMPSGHTQDEIDIFHEGDDGYIDITESRDTDALTVTGRTFSFSKFVVAIAIHDSPQEDVIRKQLFVGQNDLIFNELEVRTVAFDASEYSIGSTVTVNINDETVDIDELSNDTIQVTVFSDHDPLGILISLNETGSDTALFAGTFRLVLEASSSSDRHLHVAPGDTISVSYLSAAKGPFRIIFDNVTESGAIDLQRFTVDPRADINIPDFDPIGDGYNVQLFDVQLADNAKITVTMSYANVDLRNDEIISTDLFRLVQFDPESPPSGAFEWIDITLNNPGAETFAIDPILKTVTGATTFVGNYTIAHDLREIASGPGGGGGGLPRPGTGIILLDSATIPGSDNTGHRAGGGGGGGKAALNQIPSGNGVETSIDVGSEIVSVRFDSLQSNTGQIKVEPQDISRLEEKFDEVVATLPGDEYGIVHIDGAEYSTTGTIFEIDTSKIEFEGMVYVTLQYDEDEATSSSDMESNVRFLHFDEELDLWEDATISIDTEKNTVTGKLSSLSPVVAAVVDDGTFAEVYFEHNPLGKITMAASNSGIVSAELNKDTPITALVKNVQRVDQTFAYVLQIVDNKGVAQHISWQTGTLSRGENIEAVASWIAEKEGNYAASIFVWDDMENPSILSDPIHKQLVVSE
ncbi:MAG TPA: sialidase family protein [Nitrososphaera sp.]